MLRRSSAMMALILVIAVLVGTLPSATIAADHKSGELTPPAGGGTVTLTWAGQYFASSANVTPFVGVEVCDDSTNVTCDTYTFHWNPPADYWESHEGGVTVEVGWADSSNDFDVYVYDSKGNEVNSSPTGNNPEVVDLGKLAPGSYTVAVVAFLVIDSDYSGKVTLNTTEIPVGMLFRETKQMIMDLLTVEYPVNVVFVGAHPTAEQIADMERWIPDNYKPTVANKSPGGDEVQHTGAGLLNWNKNHLITSTPYFLGIHYKYKLRFIQASDEYARALFQVAKDNTAQAQAYKSSSRGEDQVRYDALYGHYRVAAKGGDLSYKVSDPTRTDLIDAYAVEDWIFNSRYDAQWQCAFKDIKTNACYDPSVIQPDPSAYHDPFYDKHGLNLDHMPQGLNKGSSFFFLDTFTPEYAKDYFRPNAYHTYGTDKVINGAIIDRPIEEGGSWRITDPDTKAWDGVDFGRTWGGRYRFHFIDIGAAPNTFEGMTWLGRERQYSSDYPHGDPPVWQYQADPRWQQTGEECAPDPVAIDYTGGTPCRMMPRLGRDVAYGLFFRSTAGYLYRPIPRADVNWLATSTWTDFYSRPQWVNGQLTSAPWYGTWWTDTDKLYKINQAGDESDDVLRWLSSATPYNKWVGRKGESIPLYDPQTNQPTGIHLDTAPKYEDLPAPKYHVQQGTTGANLVREPLYPGDDKPVIVNYGYDHHGKPRQVNLTQISNIIEKAKALGIVTSYDLSVRYQTVRDHIDANRPGIADVVTDSHGPISFPLVNTIPSVNLVFEKAYTWALPAIVGGVAAEGTDGEAWGVFNNVNDRFKWSQSHHPAVQPGDAPGSKRSMTNEALPTQDNGGGFSYTVEHEAAHNLGLSHPHDGSYGVDRCPDDPQTYGERAGKWECYWSGLGYMYDISAAPTTYAMAYRPYEVEDQDNLQRGHVAEYLLGAQDALRTRLIVEAQAGRTEPSAEWSSDYARMREWRELAGQLFRNGDYLHAEYAARNAQLAARGFQQSEANTIAPSRLEAGQVYYFDVNPQITPQSDLTVTDVVASKTQLPHQTLLTATVSNAGSWAAEGVTVRFFDGASVLGESGALALPAGASATVSILWNTKGAKGEYVIAAVVDPDNAVAESNEDNNRAQRTVTIKGNKVTNGSFEQSSSGSTPDAWTGTQGTSYGSAGTSDGSRAVAITGNGGPASLLGATWTSTPIAVTAGETYNLAMTVTTQGASSGPGLQVLFLDATGSVLSSATALTTSIAGDSAARQVLGQVSIPPGVSQVRLVLSGFSATDLATQGTIYFDDVQMW